MVDVTSLRLRIKTVFQLRRSLSIVWRYAAGWTAVNAVLVFIQGLFPVAAFYLMKQIVDTVTMYIDSPGQENQNYSWLMLWVVLAALVALFAALSRSFGEYTSSAQSLTLSDKVADLLHEKSHSVDLAYYENSSYYDTLHRAQEEAPLRLPRIVEGLIEIARSVTALLGIVVLMFSFSGFLVLGLFVATIPVAVIRLLYSQKSFELDRAQTEPERKAWYYHSILTDMAEAKEVRVFNLGRLLRERFQLLKKTMREERLELLRSRVVLDMIAQLLVVLALFGSIVWIVSMTINGKSTLGELVAFYLAFQGGLSYMQAAFYAFADVYEDNLFLSNLHEFLGIEPEITRPENPHPVPGTMRKGVEFKDLVFTYPGNNRPALKGIDLTLSPGEVIAIVGDNGSGKTTLVKLLCRLYDPSSGKITADDLDLKRFDPAEWRKKISVVFQDYAHYALTVQENIWFGNIDRPPDADSMKEVAYRSGAASFIKKLPDAYDTELGRWFTDGHELSIGEWQKLAIARTFWRDADIFVFDEPSSSLDPIAEAQLLENFRSLLKGKSAILISHRFSTIRMADCVYVMKEGEIVEKGTHEDLLENNGHYAELYRTQAKHYESPERQE